MLNAQLQTVAEQEAGRKTIISAFKKMWDTNPSEKDFKFYASGVVMFPEMLYYMVTKAVTKEVTK